ncbi:MAG: DUF4143 domain-containing protein [Bdellovibrionales bacterium]
MYIQSKSLKKVRKVQEALLQTYRDDFLKYAKKNKLDYLERIFNFVPFNLGKKIKYSEILPDVKSTELRKAVDLLIKARVIIPVYHTQASGLPISSYFDDKIFKLYFIDSGLALCAQGFSKDEVLEDAQGYIFEQVIAQHLYMKDSGHKRPELYYWLNEKTTGKAEVDFVIQMERQIIPVEVKSGKTGSLKSLWQMIKLKKIRMAIHFSSRPALKRNQSYNYSDGITDLELSALIYELPHYLAFRVGAGELL